MEPKEIQTNGHVLLVVEVPIKANITLSRTGLVIRRTKPILGAATKDPRFSRDEYEFLGEITKEGEFSFDPSELVDMKEAETHKLGTLSRVRFISILELNGVYLKNPIGKREEIGQLNSEKLHVSDKLVKEAWESYQSKTLGENSKFVILKLLK